MRRLGEELEGLSLAEPIMSAAGVGGHTDCSAGESSERPRGIKKKRRRERERERSRGWDRFRHFSPDFSSALR